MLTALLFWIIIGLVAGFLASIMMRGRGYGVIGDIVVGIVGALIGGFITSAFGLTGGGLIYSIVVAFVGACILIAILHAISRGTRRTLDSPPTYQYDSSSNPYSQQQLPYPPQKPTSQWREELVEPSKPLLQSKSSWEAPLNLERVVLSEPVEQTLHLELEPVKQSNPLHKPPTLSLFVSHSSRDDEFGLRLVHDLRRELGGDEAVWYDSEGGLYGGDSWWRRIVSVLEKCDVFVIIISSNSMNSKWVMKELDIATGEGKRIIPILYRQCDIPADLRAIQYISFLDTVPYSVAFDRLMQALKR